MKNKFSSIAESLRTLGIIGPIIFTSSAVLKFYNLLDRDITDIDIILLKNNKNIRIISALKKLFSLGTAGSSNSHTVLYYKNLHLDIFLIDNETVECFGVIESDYSLATPKHIISQKMKYNREKDKNDIQNISLNALDLLILNIGQVK